MARPPLPYKHVNPHLKKLTPPNLPPVKYQILSCQGKEILVGRLKIEIPENGHAFILRRFDTDALSVTTMFRAAFPTSSEADERTEIAWVKDNHDLSGNNGSSREPHLTRLAGTWVGADLAMELAESYGLAELVHSMVVATPDPKGNYRRSHKATAAANTSQAVKEASATPAPPAATAVNGTPAKPTSTPKLPSKSLPTPSPTTAPPAAKRRKESSPARAASPARSYVSSSPATPKVSQPRRSARTKSPAPSRTPVALTSFSTSKPRSRSSVAPPSPAKKEVELPKVTPSPVKRDEEDVLVEDGIASSQLYEEDISEQKRLIAELKAGRDKILKSPVKRNYEQDEDMNEEEEEEASSDEDESEGPSKLKRARPEEDEPLRFEFKEPEREERQIATNRRVGRFNMEPRTKSIAWGLAAFAVGMGAVSFLPNLF